MRIVDRKTFLAMPGNTVFSKYEPCIFGELLIKGETWKNDFLFQPIADAIDGATSDNLFEEMLDKEQIIMDFDCEGRDGLFEEKQLFAVWEYQDIWKLIERLKKCLL